MFTREEGDEIGDYSDCVFRSYFTDTHLNGSRGRDTKEIQFSAAPHC